MTWNDDIERGLTEARARIAAGTVPIRALLGTADDLGLTPRHVLIGPWILEVEPRLQPVLDVLDGTTAST